MKRKPLILALALLLVVGAALWGVNYRLDHPPLTKADKEFRALVAGADSVRVFNVSPPKYEGKDVTLSANQTQELIQKLRFSETYQPLNPESFYSSENGTDYLLFFRGNERLTGFDFWQVTKPGEMTEDHPEQPEGKISSYKLTPRSTMRLNRALDAYLPQRIRP